MPRVLNRHKKYFALLKTGFDNQSRYTYSKTFRRHVLISIGWWEMVTDKNKNTFPDAKSMKFDKCSQSDFEEIYKRTVSYFIGTLAINQTILSKVMEYEN